MADRSYQDRDTLAAALLEHGSYIATANHFGVWPSTISTWASRYGLTHRVESVENSSPEELELDVDHIDDISSLLAERGMTLDDWVVTRVTVNKWEANAGGGEKMPLRQLKVYLRAKVSAQALLQPATVLPTIRRLPMIPQNRASKLFFIYGDDQRPHHDDLFEELKLDWVRENQPDEIIDLGDGMDLPTVSMHKINPAMNWTVQQCANSYATWLWRLRAEAGSARIRILADNHITGRLRDYQLANATALYGVRPAEVAGLEKDLEPLWSVRRLLRLDELNIEYVAPPGDTHYAESHVELVPGELVALHGYRTGRNLGEKFLDDYGVSVIYGHQHGQDLYVTDQNRRGIGKRRRLFALGVGCGAILQGGGGFAPGADWQNCALTVSVFPDGDWTFDYINYEDGVLSWRDQQFS